MTLTTEQIIKLIAPYIGQQFINTAIEGSEPETLCGIDKNFNEVATTHHLVFIDNVKLLLTPDTKISKEDSDYIDSIYNGWIPNQKSTIVDINCAIVLTQFLFERGYDVARFIAPNHPANGKTLIELGLAIDKTTVVTNLVTKDNIEGWPPIDPTLEV